MPPSQTRSTLATPSTSQTAHQTRPLSAPKGNPTPCLGGTPDLPFSPCHHFPSSCLTVLYGMNGWVESCSLGTGCSRTGGSAPRPHPSFQILASPFSALHPFGLTMTLGQVSSMACHHVPMAGGRGVSEDRVVSALPLPAHVPPCTGLALRGAQKSLSRGMCEARATPRSPHQQTTETAVPPGDPWPLIVHQEAGPGGSPRPPPCFTRGGNSKHRANQAIFRTEWGSASQSEHRTNLWPLQGGMADSVSKSGCCDPHSHPPTSSRACGGPGDVGRTRPPVPRLSRKPPFCREKLMKGRSLGNYELPPAISPSKESGGMAD